MNSDKFDHRTEQNISGESHQIAGRDFILNGGYSPHPNNPKLMSCKECGKPGISQSADICPVCQYNFAADRALAAERSQQEIKDFFAQVTFIIMIVLFGTFVLDDRTDYGVLNSFVVSVFAMGLLFSGWCFLKAHLTTWLKQRR